MDINSFNRDGLSVRPDERYTNYIMAKNNFNEGSGSISVGSITETDNYTPNTGDYGYSLIYTLFDESTTPASILDYKTYNIRMDFFRPGPYYSYTYSKGHVVDITPMVDMENTFLLTLSCEDPIHNFPNLSYPAQQGRWSIGYILIECHDFNNPPNILGSYFYNYNDFNIYPYSTVIGDDGAIYTCGYKNGFYTRTGVTDHYDSSLAFISKVAKLGGGHNMIIKPFNSPKPPPTPSPFPGGTPIPVPGYDYDSFTKLYNKNGKIVAIGSANHGITSPATFNTSCIWIKTFEQDINFTENPGFFIYDANITNMPFTHLRQFPGQFGDNVGLMGGDLIEDHNNPGEFFLTFQQLSPVYTGITHLNSNFEITFSKPYSGYLLPPDSNLHDVNERIVDIMSWDNGSLPDNHYLMINKRSYNNSPNNPIPSSIPSYSLYEMIYQNSAPQNLSIVHKSSYEVKNFYDIWEFSDIQHNWQQNFPFYTRPKSAVKIGNSELFRVDHIQYHPGMNNAPTNYQYHPRFIHTEIDGGGNCNSSMITNHVIGIDLAVIPEQIVEQSTVYDTYETYPTSMVYENNFNMEHCSQPNAQYRITKNSINTQNSHNNLTVFYNKFSSCINIKTTSANTHYHLYTVHGQMVLSGNSYEANIQVPVQLTPGVYFLKTDDDQQTIQTHKIYID